ncbi:ATP-binding protein [Streptomonospora salina]|uniref:Anti-sigma regulatory factor (Ser/Thr protein kinase) n=1 Tax=Streptomonospora salina TaxID=104205 RepID=A0A841ECT5_9ACTN|nr:ATP-binding protein [Streptomonospora salina]MBB6000955.1 anti-sigma regulatory factor (Ser/Thr protein kinase) [Streptomonospora salina]
MTAETEHSAPAAPAGGDTLAGPGEPDHRLSFAGQPASVGALRDWAARCLRRGPFAHPPDLVEDLLVCASELATNAVRHSGSGLPGGTFTARLWQDRRRVRLEVADLGPRPGRPTLPRIDGSLLGDGAAENGRGLGFVAALCGGECGATAPPDPRGHAVWCELARPAGPGPEEAR